MTLWSSDPFTGPRPFRTSSGQQRPVAASIESCSISQDRGTQSIKLSLSGISGDRWPGLLSELLALPEITQAIGRTDED